MAHYSSITVAALAAALALFAGSMQVFAAEAEVQETEAATESKTEAAETGWITKNGKQYYILSDGSYAVGETEIDGVPYLFGFSGALKTDWQTISDKRYYYDPATGEAVFGWIDYFDCRYYVTEEEGKLTGFQEIDGTSYAFSPDGALYMGEFFEMDNHYYASPETGTLQEGLIVDEDDAVLTDTDGVVVSGWYVTAEGKKFYSNPETGYAELGLVCIDGEYYYISAEEGMLTGMQIQDGEEYPLDEETGVLADGWYVSSGMTYYYDRSAMSLLKNGLNEIDGSYYYFDVNGAVASGWYVTADGRSYYCDPETQQVELGLVCIGSDYYYMTAEEGMRKGLQEIDGVVYALDENTGVLANGWYICNGVKYYYNREKMALLQNMMTKIDDSYYYFDADGAVATGWKTIDNNLFWFCEDGTLFTSGTLDVNGKTYLFDENGQLCYGWQTIGGQEYYFHENGTMARSETIVINQMAFTFNADGILTGCEERPADQTEVSALPASGVLDVISYKQKDARWTNVLLGTSSASSIGKVGCLVTSLAMVQSYKTKTELTPIDIKKELSFSSGGGLSSWNLVINMGYTVETFNSAVTETHLMKIYVQLQAGCPVILGSKKSGGGQHYVVVTGYVGDGKTLKASDFTINDPGYSTRPRLSDHLAQYSTLYKLIY